MARSLNRVQLIGNLTRDPELRYTPNGNAVCTFGLATNRSWTTDAGDKREETDFHRIVAWNKLAELCSQFLVKGRKVYVEGRLSTRSWTGQDGQQKSTTEIVIEDMILLDSKGGGQHSGGSEGPSEPKEEHQPAAAGSKKHASSKEEAKDEASAGNDADEVMPEDIPF